MQAMQQRVVPVEYIGQKEFKIDNVNHTKTVWKGNGDVQLYPLDKAAALLRGNEKVWRLAKPDQVKDGAVVVDGAGAVQQLEEPTARQATQAALSKDVDPGTPMGEAAREGPSAPPSRSQRSLE